MISGVFPADSPAKPATLAGGNLHALCSHKGIWELQGIKHKQLILSVSCLVHPSPTFSEGGAMDITRLWERLMYTERWMVAWQDISWRLAILWSNSVSSEAPLTWISCPSVAALSVLCFWRMEYFFVCPVM